MQLLDETIVKLVHNGPSSVVIVWPTKTRVKARTAAAAVTAEPDMPFSGEANRSGLADRRLRKGQAVWFSSTSSIVLSVLPEEHSDANRDDADQLTLRFVQPQVTDDFTCGLADRLQLPRWHEHLTLIQEHHDDELERLKHEISLWHRVLEIEVTVPLGNATLDQYAAAHEMLRSLVLSQFAMQKLELIGLQHQAAGALSGATAAAKDIERTNEAIREGEFVIMFAYDHIVDHQWEWRAALDQRGTLAAQLFGIGPIHLPPNIPLAFTGLASESYQPSYLRYSAPDSPPVTIAIDSKGTASSAVAGKPNTIANLSLCFESWLLFSK